MRLTMANTSALNYFYTNPFQTPLNLPKYSLDTPLAGQFLSFFGDKDDDDDENQKDGNLTDYERAKIKFYEDAREDQKYYRSPEYLDDMYKRADDLNAKQMARAQKYGKESAFYGFMYQGLPNLMAQAAFSKYAFAPEMVKAVTDAYSRINASPAGMTNYMAINPMGRGIG